MLPVFFLGAKHTKKRHKNLLEIYRDYGNSKHIYIILLINTKATFLSSFSLFSLKFERVQILLSYNVLALPSRRVRYYINYVQKIISNIFRLQRFDKNFPWHNMHNGITPVYQLCNVWRESDIRGSFPVSDNIYARYSFQFNNCYFLSELVVWCAVHEENGRVTYRFAVSIHFLFNRSFPIEAE